MTQTQEAPVTVQDPQDEDAPPARPRRRVTATVVLAAVVALLLVAAVVLGVLWQRERAEAAEREEALATAQRFAANFLSVSVDDFDEATGRVLADATGDAAEEYSAGLEALRAQLQENSSTTDGTVLSRGLVSLGEDDAEALVVADSEVTTGDQVTNVLHYRMRLSLQEVDGDWKVSEVSFVQA